MLEEGQKSPANVGNELALARTVFALDRTLLAWIRTSLSLIGFGFALVKFIDSVLAQNKLGVPPGLALSPKVLGFTMMLFGLFCLCGGTFDYWLSIKKMRKLSLEIPSWSTCSLLAIFLAIFTLVFLICLIVEVKTIAN